MSFTAIQILRHTHRKGLYVVADGTKLPFKADVFSHTICSEVLEHIRDDVAAIQEFARVIRPAGCLLITFPHRKFYFGIDDRFVGHYRRYEILEMENKLKEYGLKPISIKKILGPLEKVTMCVVVICFSMMQKLRPQKLKAEKKESERLKKAKKEADKAERKKLEEERKSIQEERKQLQEERERIEKEKEYIQRKNKLQKIYGLAIAKKILDHQIWIGMDKEMAHESLGAPIDINRTVTEYSIHEQWVYYSDVYLYFDNGILTSWQD